MLDEQEQYLQDVPKLSALSRESGNLF